MIKIDDMSCSIVWPEKIRWARLWKATKGRGEQYIYVLNCTEHAEIFTKKLVGIDPNMGDLNYSMDNDQPDESKFWYTQDTWCIETKL